MTVFVVTEKLNKRLNSYKFFSTQIKLTGLQSKSSTFSKMASI